MQVDFHSGSVHDLKSDIWSIGAILYDVAYSAPLRYDSQATESASGKSHKECFISFNTYL